MARLVSRDLLRRGGLGGGGRPRRGARGDRSCRSTTCSSPARPRSGGWWRRRRPRTWCPARWSWAASRPRWCTPDYPMRRAAERIAVGKLLQRRADLHRARLRAGAARARRRASPRPSRPRCSGAGPMLATSEQYTAMASQKGFERMKALLEDAKAKGARIEVVAPDGEPKEGRKMAPTLVFGVTDEMKLMEEEIFGPLLPVKSYRTLERGARLRARPPAAARALLLRPRRAPGRADARAHHLGRRLRQRHALPLRPGAAALRRRGPQRHGRATTARRASRPSRTRARCWCRARWRRRGRCCRRPTASCSTRR